MTMSEGSNSRWLVRAATAAVGAFALAGALATSGPAASAATTGTASQPSRVVKAAGGHFRLHRIGTVNLRALARADARRQGHASHAPASGAGRMAPLGQPPVAAGSGNAPNRAPSAAGLLTKIGGNVSGEHGFDGITAAINGAANSPITGGLGDVSPPDQALAVGPSSAGTAIVEYVNDTLNIYSPKGKTLLGAIPSYQIYGLPGNAFLTDPRAYRDPQTGHWFLTQFIFGDGVSSPLSTQYIAVSETTSPFGPYATFSIDTSDSTNTAGGCPCYGDFDQVGIDNSGFFISTNQFSVDEENFNGTVIYAMSKRALITAARSSGSTPTVQTYVVPYASDPFGAYHLSPSVVTPGSSAPNTEYFVESNSSLNYGSGLEVYALLNTTVLNAGGRPRLVETKTRSESYSFPPNAIQRSGPTPYGCSIGTCATASLDTDFNAIQEVTYASGKLYTELNTGFNYGTGQNSGAAWFILTPKPMAGSVRITNITDGYVKSSQYILYPVIGVNKYGHGYMNFAISSSTRYPSTAYVVFGPRGTSGPIHLAARGVNPLDDFTCYPPDSTGQCRYGDYSMAQYYNGKIYMASEYVPPQPRDVLSNWGTRIWYAPVP